MEQSTLQISFGPRDLEKIKEDWIRALTRIEENRMRMSKIEHSVGQAKHRTLLQPKVRAFLESLQHRAHSRGIGMYENLLTTFNREILPQVKKPVVMDLTTERGMPALSIQMGRDEHAEDLWDGSGGSLTNVVSLGLRYISLSRSPLRKFLFLDEPDCWMEDARVPDFGRIVAQMAENAKVQTVLITHKSLHLFDRIQHRVHLEPCPINGVRVTYPFGTPIWQDDQIGIRKIQLIDLMSHGNSIIELSPTSTLLSGPNHTGKSVPAACLRAMTQGSATDRVIRDGKDKGMLILYVEDGKRLEWTRYRGKANPKETFALYDKDGNELNKARGERGNIPSFVQDVLHINPLQDLDIQLHHQKLPVFLLDKPASKQAQILSAGMESEYLHSMMEKYKSMLTNDKKETEIGEREITLIKNLIEKAEAAIRGSDSDSNIKEEEKNLTNVVNDLKNQYDAIIKESLEIEEMEKDLKSLEILKNRVEIQNKALKEINLPETIPELEAIDEMASLYDGWEDLRVRVKVLAPVRDIVLPEIPELEETIEMAEDGNSWMKLRRKLKILREIDIQLPPEPELEDLVEMNKEINELEKLAKEKMITEKSLNDAKQKQIESMKKLNELIEKIGGNCPTCHQTMTVSHLTEENHAEA